MQCPLLPSTSVEKEELGFFDHCSDNRVFIVQWMDNKVVYLGLNFRNIEPTKMVKCYSQREKKKISCVQPFCFYKYNQDIRGIDQLESLISQYRPAI